MKLLVLLFILSFSTFAGKRIPGLIPKNYSIKAASDLEISAAKAHARAVQGEDISLISPLRNTNIWSANKSSISNNDILSGERVSFVSSLSSRIGKLRFTVKDELNGHVNLVLSKKVHNILLRKNLLEKLGFNVPKMNWYKQVQVDFPSKIDKELFIEDMQDELIADSKRWIVEEGEKYLVLRDLVAKQASSNIYDLTVGVMPKQIHRERRLLKSPYIALSIVDTPESINLFPWEAGRVVLEQIKLNHTNDLANTYNTSYEDARWILRRIAHLTRSDWEEIVEKAFFPAPVAKLLVEKLLNRRNDILDLFDLRSFPKIAVQTSVHYGHDLVDSEITKEFFEGYVSRFSFGDPESPFSNSEMGSYVLSRVQSEIFNTAINKFNKLIGTNDTKQFAEQVRNIIKEDGVFFPTQAFVVPSIHGNIIMSRDIVTGSYLGSDNKVQLVDNLGFGIDASAAAGVVGLPFNIGLKAKAGLAFQRVYSHIKPIESLKKAMREPYKNMMVPFVLKGIAKKINKLSSVTEENKSFLMASIVGDLKKSIGVGESFVITDSVGPRLAIDAELSISTLMAMPSDLLKVYVGIQSQRLVISRFHIHRPSKNVLHFYQDDGKSLKLSMSFKLSSYVPVLALSGTWHRAEAKTKFYTMSLSGNDVTPEALKAIRLAFLKQSSNALEKISKPHTIDHILSEKTNTISFLFFKRTRIGSKHGMKITHRLGGEVKQIRRRYDSFTNGKDLENYSIAVLNEVVSSVLKKDYSLSSSNSINPGFTIKGKARNTILNSEFDGEFFHTKYQKIYNGWKAKNGRLKRIIRRINNSFGAILIDPLSYKNTNSILLYQVSLNATVDHIGVQNILTASKEKITEVFTKYSELHEEDISSRIPFYLKRFAKLRSMMKTDVNRMLKKWHKTFKKLSEDLKFTGIISLAGKKNIMALGKIDGFREGDEAGDSSILSDVYGDLDMRLQPSPSEKIMSKISILGGELYLNWLAQRAI